MSKLDDFVIEEWPLGSGGQGCAFYAVRVADKIPVVLKKIHIGPILYDQKQVQRAKDEAKFLLKFHHQNIVKFFSFFEVTSEQSLYIHMEFCSGGDLSKKICAMKEKKERFSEDQIVDWFTTLTMTVKYMHDEKVIHMDLKHLNIFFADEDGKTLKIGDFGVAKLRSTTKSTLYTSGIAGTPTHLPPEAFDGTYGFKTDVWALGVILFELVSFELPFPGKTVTEVMKNIIKLMEDLVNKLLEPDLEKRPSIHDISLYTPQQRKLFLEQQLIAASQNGDVSKLESSLKQGISVDYKDQKGRTALIFAATGGHLKMVEQLIDAGANPNCKTTLGLTALICAIRNGHLGIVNTLVSKGLDVNGEDDNGMTPLLYAASIGNLNLVKFFVEKGAEINAEDRRGWTALFYASRNGHDEVAKFLQTVQGIRANHKDLKGRTVQWHEAYHQLVSKSAQSIDGVNRCLTASQKSLEYKSNNGVMVFEWQEKSSYTLTYKIDLMLAYIKFMALRR